MIDLFSVNRLVEDHADYSHFSDDEERAVSSPLVMSGACADHLLPFRMFHPRLLSCHDASARRFPSTSRLQQTLC